MARVLRPGGLAVLALPNILSLKGLVTRLTPWWFHVWVYRHVLGDRSAGTDAFDQFPTAFRFVLRPAGLRQLVASHGLRVEDLRLYEGPVPQHLRRRHRSADVALSVAGRVTRLASAGRYDTTLSDMVVVLSRPGATSRVTTRPRRLRILGTRGIPNRHGGFEACAQHLAPWLVARGWDVTVYCQEEPGSELPPGYAGVA